MPSSFFSSTRVSSQFSPYEAFILLEVKGEVMMEVLRRAGREEEDKGREEFV